LVLLLTAASAGAVELDDILQALLDQALTLNITARVTENGHETVQSYELTRVTISGRAVRLRLEGGNIIVIAEFTPYENDEGMVLVAEGQILLRTNDEEEVQYSTSLRSVPITTGEKVVFYPLGRSEPLSGDAVAAAPFNIELEVEIVPYEAEQG
jgi:hypothetical protein